MSVVYIIIVTFNPDIDNLMKMIGVLEECRCNVVIVDNTGLYSEIEKICSRNTKIIKLNDNRGIAEAQNIGLRYALENNARVIGFFDQDSTVSVKIVEKLILALEEKEISVVAPRSIDSITKEEYPSQIIGRFGIPKDIYSENCNPHKCVDIVISSGTFAKKEVFEKVGLFDESFFIDFVDIEWCLRCRKQGIKIWLIRDAVMEHHIGNNLRKIGVLTVNVHSPYRTYYKIRNSFLLFSKDVGFLFCLRQLFPAIVHNFFLLFDKKRGREYMKYYFRGIEDGVCKRGGKYENWHRK